MKTKYSILLLLMVFGLASCTPKKESDDDALLGLLLLSLTQMQGDCSVTAAGRSLNTFVTDTTGTNPKSGIISRSSLVPVVNHITSLLKVSANVGTTIATTNTRAFGIVYQGTSCPLPASSLQAVGSSYSLTSGTTDSNSEFTGSHKIEGNSSTITFTRAGTYYYLFYQIPRQGQSGTITYSVVNGN